MKKCIMKNCKGDYLINEFCKKHNSMFLDVGKDGLTRIKRLESRLRNKDGCHIWTGSITQADRLKVNTHDTSFVCNRFVWEYHNKEILINRGAMIIQSCKNILCLNPKHLQLIKRKYVFERRIASGEYKVNRNEKSPVAKLTNKEALSIYQAAWKGTQTAAQIAENFAITPTTVSAIKHGRSWVAVTGHRKYVKGKPKSSSKKPPPPEPIVQPY